MVDATTKAVRVRLLASLNMATHYAANGSTGYVTVCPHCVKELCGDAPRDTVVLPDGSGTVVDFSAPIQDTPEDCQICSGDFQ